MKKETQIGGTAADPCYAGRDNPIRASGIKKTGRIVFRTFQADVPSGSMWIPVPLRSGPEECDDISINRAC